MGVSQVNACLTVKGQTSFIEFSTLGLVTTYSADSYVTDSAASGTALATGQKTNNGMISMRPDSTTCKTVLEYAEDLGLSTGLVTTCSITHATPAVFASHVPRRGMYEQIAEQIAASGVDVLFAGGRGYFLPQSKPNSLRHDDKDLWTELARTHSMIRTPAGLDSLENVQKAVGLFYQNHPPAAGDRNYSLADVTFHALEILSRNKAGFFLMVEGSQIDWMGHSNNSQGIIDEMIDFDSAVKAGLSFARKAGDVLVLVTADHETGGYSLLDGSVENHSISNTAFTTGGHTGVMVPLFAFGPGSSVFAGIQDNTHIGSALIDLVKKIK